MTPPFWKHKTFWILVGIILIGAFFRLYHFYDPFEFRGDQAVPMFAIEQIWKAVSHFDFVSLPLQGPYTPSTNTHHGAFFFYLLTFPAIVSNFHPYGPALFIIAFNIAAVYLMYLCGKKLLGEQGGLIAALLFATSSLGILYGRGLYNPNLIIFFVLLALASFLKIREGNPRYWSLFAFAIASTTQMHILGYAFVLLFFIPLILFTRIVYPRGTTLFLTTILFFFPLIPEIFSEISTGFSLIKNAWGFVAHEISIFFTMNEFLESFLDRFVPAVKGLSGFFYESPKVLGLGVQPIMFFLLLLILIAWGIEILRPNFQKKSWGLFPIKKILLYVFSILSDSVKIRVFILWVFALLTIVFLSGSHPGDPKLYTFLFGLPLILFFYAALIQYALSRAWLFVPGFLVLLVFLYVNSVAAWKSLDMEKPSFQDQQQLLEYLKFRHNGEQTYTIDTRYGPLVPSLRWFFTHSSSTPLPIRLNDYFFGDQKIADSRYFIVTKFDNHPERKICTPRAFIQSFGPIDLYRCIEYS